MHEMSLCESVLKVIEEKASSGGYQRVTGVWLEIGTLAGVEKEALRFCFDAVVRGSVAEGAKLEIIDVSGEAWCMQCSQSVVVAQRFDECPKCGSYQLQVTQGDELRIKELEVE